MPTYTACCPKCGRVHEYKSSIADRAENRPVCCGEKTEGVIIHPPMGFVDKPAAPKD